jgi:lactobin A/cerein 7B family class IIb bacteriocin
MSRFFKLDETELNQINGGAGPGTVAAFIVGLIFWRAKGCGQEKREAEAK